MPPRLMTPPWLRLPESERERVFPRDGIVLCGLHYYILRHTNSLLCIFADKGLTCVCADAVAPDDAPLTALGRVCARARIAVRQWRSEQ